MKFLQHVAIGSLMILSVATDTVVSAGKIKIRAEDENGTPAAGIRVDCYDYDPGNRDDYMGGGFLDANGYLEVNYAATTTSFWRCYKWWDACLNTKPDIYCNVAQAGDCFTPDRTVTKDSQNQKGTTDFGTIVLETNESFCDTDAFYNGCGTDSFPTWIKEVAHDLTGFNAACNAHDDCYEECATNGKSQQVCDDEFLDDMEDACDDDFACNLAATTFYYAVVAGGSEFFEC